MKEKRNKGERKKRLIISVLLSCERYMIPKITLTTSKVGPSFGTAQH